MEGAGSCLSHTHSHTHAHTHVSSRRHVSDRHTRGTSRTRLLTSLPSQGLAPPAFAGSGDPGLPVSVGKPRGYPPSSTLSHLQPPTSKLAELPRKPAEANQPAAAAQRQANTCVSPASSRPSPLPPSFALQPALRMVCKQPVVNKAPLTLCLEPFLFQIKLQSRSTGPGPSRLGNRFSGHTGLCTSPRAGWAT